MIRRLAKEPLVHFLLIGGCMFFVYGLLNREAPQASEELYVSAAEIEWLTHTWSKQWSRAPDEGEMQAMFDGYLNEMLLAKEAVALGLDQNDTVIRRRLAQKMEFVVQDTARLGEPEDALLMRFHEQGAKRYSSPETLSFTQVFFRTREDARAALAQLTSGVASDRLGDTSLLERQHVRVEESAVRSQFGDEFSHELFTQAPGQWHGPLASTYGFHLVRIDQRVVSQVLPYDAVKARVREDWQQEQQQLAQRRYLAELRQKYPLAYEESLKPLMQRMQAAEP